MVCCGLPLWGEQMCVSPKKSFVTYKQQEGRKRKEEEEGRSRKRKQRGKWRRRMLKERGERKE